jgi:selenocysteine-specific elongation factor
MSHIIIGTAGHIDHGKTALVRALTGMDPDRLKEEKERQITIDLGFAFLGDKAAIIDVPGHERFIKNMVAGVATIDMVLFVVAADDGVMPQTKEHLDILRLLGVKHGIIVLTKADLVDEEWLELVKADVQELMSGTFLENASVYVVDSLSGRGVEELKFAILKTIETLPGKVNRGMFRLPIDRVFTIKGFGTVVTGTVLSGTAKAESVLEVQPQGIKVKVRGVQSHEQSVAQVLIGDRAALNLQGVEVSDLTRGDVLGDPGYFFPSNLLDGCMMLLATAKPFSHRTRVRVHLGTQEVIGRVILLDRDVLNPGEEAFVRLRLEAKCVAARKDPFVVRQYSPQITIGGGVILDPLPPERRKRFDREVIEWMKVLDQDDPELLIVDCLKLSPQIEISYTELLSITGLTREKLNHYLETIIGQSKIVRIGSGERAFFIHAERLRNSFNTMMEKVQQHHQSNPLLPGISREELRTKCNQLFSKSLCEIIIEELLTKGRLVSDGHWIKAADFKIRLSPAQQQSVTQIEGLLHSAKFQTPKIEEIISHLNLPSDEVRELVSIMATTGRIVRIGTDLLFLDEQIAQAKHLISQYFQSHPEITVGEVSSLLGSTRKYVVPLLEYFDREGFTERREDIRIKKAYSGKTET